MNLKLKNHLEQALKLIPNANEGLDEDVFYFVSQLTPLINVDLLIKDEIGRTLLTWRDDRFYGPGWHIPGGIIRFKENIEDRIMKVAEIELGCSVNFSSAPINVRGLINSERNIRGHFISLLYLCRLTSMPDFEKAFVTGNPMRGQWAWHDGAPANLLKVHESFRQFIDDKQLY